MPPESHRDRAKSAACLIMLLNTEAHAQDLAPMEIFRRVSPSIVVVEATTTLGGLRKQGSGVVIEGGIVTNRHVVEGAMQVQVRQGERTWPVRISHWDSDHDLVMLGAEGFAAPAVSLRNSRTLSTGERVYAIGAPKGWELTLSEGLISALRRVGDVEIIQTSAPVSHGSSGGGLLDTHGRLIGITTLSDTEGQNLNFALPVEWVSALRTMEGKPLPMAGPSDRLAALETAGSLMRAGHLPEAARIFVASLKAAGREAFTVQILVACNDDTVHKVAGAIPDPELLIVPVDYKGHACYRVCWGIYPSEGEAIVAAATVPDYFLRNGARPKAVVTATVLP